MSSKSNAADTKYAPPPVPPQYRKETVTGASPHGAAPPHPKSAAEDVPGQKDPPKPELKRAIRPNRICPQCGTQHLVGQRFCARCGGQLNVLAFALIIAIIKLIIAIIKVLKWPATFIVLATGALVGVAEWDQHTFNVMTPAQHLDAARAALAAKRFDDGIYQLSAIKPGASVSANAKALEGELIAGKEATTQEQVAAQEAARIAEQQREAVVQGLQARLSELGYAVTVARSDKPGELVITSNDFGDTDHRLRFLSFLRGRNSPAASACFAGFHSVRLSSGMLSPIWGFSEAYSLDCFGSP